MRLYPSLFPLLIFSLALSSSCGNSGKEEKKPAVEKKPTVAVEKTSRVEVKIKSKEDVVKRFNELGFQVFPEARLRDFENNSDMYQLLYDLGPDRNAEKRADDFYRQLSGKLERTGWVVRKSQSKYRYWLEKDSDNITIIFRHDEMFKVNGMRIMYQHR
jgi:hypothetical protein